MVFFGEVTMTLTMISGFILYRLGYTVEEEKHNMWDYDILRFVKQQIEGVKSFKLIGS